MARFIKAYDVPIDHSEAQFLLDEGAEILDVVVRYSPTWLSEVVTLFAWCEDGVPPGRPRTFKVFDTDSVIPDGAVHRGSVLVDGKFGLHLIELETDPPIRVVSERVA